MPYIFILLGIILSGFIYTLSSAIIILAVGKQLNSVSFGFGPLLLSRKIHNTEIILRCIPFFGSTRFEISNTISDGVKSKDRITVKKVYTWSGVIILLTPIIILLLIGIFINGIGGSLYIYKNTMFKFIPILNSVSTATLFAKELLSLLREQSLIKSFGTICVALSAINSMPIPILDGGKVIVLIFENFFHMDENINAKIIISGCIIMATLWLYWLFILYKVILG